jgi:hypothetical protein
MVGVLSFGRGLFDREPIKNGKTSYKVFYRLKAEHVVMSQLFGWEGALALSSEQFAGKFVSPQFPTFLCDTKKLDREFLGWLMRRPMFWEDLGSRTSGMGDRRRTLNPEALFSCEIVLPPLEEQGRIVARIGEFTAKIQEARDLRKQAAEEAEALVVSTHLRLAGSRNRKLLGAELVDLLSGPDLGCFGLCLSCRNLGCWHKPRYVLGSGHTGCVGGLDHDFQVWHRVFVVVQRERVHVALVGNQVEVGMNGFLGRISQA